VSAATIVCGHCEREAPAEQDGEDFLLPASWSFLEVTVPRVGAAGHRMVTCVVCSATCLWHILHGLVPTILKPKAEPQSRPS
jgi:hypothetical protein